MMMKKRTRDAMMMNNNNQQTQKKQRMQHNNKKVSFNTSVVVNEVLHIKNYTNEERHACWYTNQERYESKYELKCIVQKMMTNQNVQHLETRGLEQYKSKQQFDLKRRTKHISRMSVLKTQTLYKQGQCYYNMISNVYMNVTQQSTKDAYLVAIQDQLETQQTQQQSKIILPTRRTMTACRINNNNQPRRLYSMAA